VKVSLVEPWEGARISRTRQHLGERLHSVLLRGYGLSERDFSHACVDRIMPTLNAARAPVDPMQAEVLWLAGPTAFTLPGRYCYIARQFIERCRCYAPAAFALAHEIGHHDLGHLRYAEVWASATATHAPLRFAALMLHRLAQRMYSRDAELAADAYAIELCRKAGYELKRCLEAFDILSWWLLNNRDLDGVYGTDEELELDPRLAANPIDWAFIEARLWLARHRRQYPAIVERRRLLESYIANLNASAGAHSAI